MKKLTVFLTLASGFALTQAQNPIIHDQFTADPTARMFGDRVYLYPSHDIPPVAKLKDWFCMADYHVFSSSNLVDWIDHGVILSQENVPWGDPAAYSMWAPDCVEKGGKYYFYFPDAPRGERGFGVGVAIADTPTGPFVPQAEPIKGLIGIDPCVLVDDDGKSYIYWAGMGIRGAELDSTMMALASAPALMDGLPEGFKEGPFAFKRAGRYYLTFPWVRSEGGTETLAYAMADTPLGPWDFKGLIMEEWADSCWTNHHSIVQYRTPQQGTSTDDDWYLFYHHNDYSPAFDKSRSARIDRLTFNPDGTINLVTPTLRGAGTPSAYTRIHIDRGICPEEAVEYIDTADTFQGWYVRLTDGDTATFTDVDFENRVPNAVKAKARSPKGAVIDINGVRLEIPATADWAEATADAGDARISADVTVRCVTGEADIDWVQFATADTQPAGELSGVYFTVPAGGCSEPDAQGFIRRWHVLEPINVPNRSNTVFTDSYLRGVFGHGHFPDQFSIVPCDGQTVVVGDSTTLKWHSLESTGNNVHLFRFASQRDKQVYGVLFWAVTVIDCPEDLENVRLSAGSNSASMWWIDGEEALILSGDRRMVMDDGMSRQLRLPKGKHTIRTAVINGPGMSNFCVRLLDEKGNPVTNYKICEK